MRYWFAVAVGLPILVLFCAIESDARGEDNLTESSALFTALQQEGSSELEVLSLEDYSAPAVSFDVQEEDVRRPVEIFINWTAISLQQYSCDDPRITSCCAIDVASSSRDLPNPLSCMIVPLGFGVSLSQSIKTGDCTGAERSNICDAAKSECDSYCQAYLSTCTLAPGPGELEKLIDESFSIRTAAFNSLYQKYKGLLCSDTNNLLWPRISHILNSCSITAGIDVELYWRIKRLVEQLSELNSNKLSSCR